MTTNKPTSRPTNANFSSGPCSKRPGWSSSALEGSLVGRSHRSKEGKSRIQGSMELTAKILGLPDDYRIGIVPASDTGAVEMCLWSLLGAKGVDMFGWESFGKGWITDVMKQLKLDDVREFTADYGQLPDLSQANPNRDIVFTWNGTTSGVCVSNADWISDDREGLTICDATSAVFAMDMPWDKLDVVTYSWQKVLGGEAAHGVLILSPRAVERLESYTPSWPMPKVFRMTKNGKLNEGIFKGSTINTPSMICVEDYIDALEWAESVGGLQGLISRSKSNLSAISEWVSRTDWVEFLAEDESNRSCTSICLKVVAPWFTALDKDEQSKAAKKLAALLDEEGVAYDIGAYRDAPAGLRIWGGATIEASDLKIVCEWLDWAYGQVESEYC